MNPGRGSAVIPGRMKLGLVACTVAVALVVGACTHVVVDPSADAPAPAASASGEAPGPGDAAPAPSANAPGEPPTCPAPPPTSAPRPWKPPPARRAACRADDLRVFEDAWSDIPRPSFGAIEATMRDASADCASCIFARQGDAAWGPIVFVSDTDAFVNTASCLMRAGGTLACAQAFAWTDECMATVCDGIDCETQEAMDQCVQRAVRDRSSCGKYDLLGACGGDAAFQVLYAQCKTAPDVARVMCGAG